jgi:hypothetical protein
VVGIGATLTRSTGVIVALALAVEAIHQTVEDWRAGGIALPRAFGRWPGQGYGSGRARAVANPLAGDDDGVANWARRRSRLVDA